MSKLYIALVCMLAFACNKEDELKPQHPTMQYTNLQNAEVRFNEFKNVDIDGDGKNDFLFQTLLVGDPILKRDRKQFYAFSKIGTYLLVDAQEQAPVLNSGDAIMVNNYLSAEWYEIAAIVLAEKIIEENSSSHWEGAWKNTAHRYLPVQVAKNGLRYTGWIELSFDAELEKIILHRAAISRVAQTDSKAGL